MLFDREPYFELLVLGRFYVDRNKIKLSQNALLGSLLRDEELAGFKMQCRTLANNATSRLVFKKNHQVDGISKRFLYRYLCPISMELVDREAAVLLQMEITALELGTSVFFEIPRSTHSIGLAGPRSNPFVTPLYLQPKVKYMLCSGGVQANGLHLLPEWLQHHLRVGFQHFMIGIDMDTSPELERNATTLLQPLIDAGVVLLSPFSTPTQYIEHIEKGTLAKNVFNEACLSYARGRAEYMGNWDADEFWMPPSVPEPGRTNILDAQIQSHVPSENCPDWCFVSFPSNSNWEKAHGVKVQQIARTITQRTPTMDYTWQKSLARVKNTLSVAPHTFGSCLANGVRGTENNGKDTGCSTKAPELGMMHHFHAIFRGGRPSENVSILIPDEYSVYALREGFPVQVTTVFSEAKHVPAKFIFNRVPGERFVP